MGCPDSRSLGRSEIVPFKSGEDWHQRHSRRKWTNLNHSAELEDWCNNRGWKFEIKNEGHHWIFRNGRIVVEWWPSSAKLVKNKQWSRGIHCHDYTKVVEFLEKQ